VLVVLAMAVDAAARAWRATPPGRISERLESLVLIVVLVTGAGGLGLFVSGPGPREALHFLYGGLAFGILPVARSLSKGARPRRQAVVTLVAALVVLVVLARLFATG
jgi:hypothetical protein